MKIRKIQSYKKQLNGWLSCSTTRKIPCIKTQPNDSSSVQSNKIYKVTYIIPEWSLIRSGVTCGILQWSVLSSMVSFQWPVRDSDITGCASDCPACVHITLAMNYVEFCVTEGKVFLVYKLMCMRYDRPQWAHPHLIDRHVFWSAKPIGSNCPLAKYAVTTFWLWKASSYCLLALHGMLFMCLEAVSCLKCCSGPSRPQLGQFVFR